MSQRSKLPWNPIKRQSLLSYKEKEKIACQLTIKIKGGYYGIRSFKMCSRASTRHASDGFPLIFFFLVAKGLFEPFFVDPTGPTTNYSHASVLALLVLATRSSTTREACTFSPALYQVRSTWKGQPSCPC